MPNSVLDAVSNKLVDATNTTWSHTVGDHPNRVLVVFVGTTGQGYAETVTFNGIALQRYGSVIASDATIQGRAADMWYLVNPPVGTFTIAVNKEAGTNTAQRNVAFSLYEVDQTTPFGTRAQRAGTTGTSSSLSPASAAGDVVIDFICARNWDGVDAGDGQTERFPYGDLSTTTGSCASSETATGSTTTMSWSGAGSSDDQAHIAVHVRGSSDITIGPVVIEYSVPTLSMGIDQTIAVGPVVVEYTVNGMEPEREVALGPVAIEYAEPALTLSQGITETLGPVLVEYTLNGMQPEREVALGPVAVEFAVPALTVTGLGPGAIVGPVVVGFSINGMQPEREVALGPVVVEYSMPGLSFLREQYDLGPVVLEYSLPALGVDQDVARSLGPVVVEYTVTTPVNDAEYARAIGPVVVEYAVNAFNIRQRPPVIRVVQRGPVVYIHSAWWPRQQLAVLTSAFDVDRSYLAMTAQQSGRQTGQASVSISASDPAISRDVVRHGNLLVIESPGMPVWAGPILTVEEEDASGSIELSALSMDALLDGRVTPQGEEYKKSTGEMSIFRSLIDSANARNQTGILPSLTLATGKSVQQLQVGGQSVMEALNEMTSRTGSEWWVDVTRSPHRLDAQVKLGVRQGTDLSGTLHLYQRVHFNSSYKSDLSQVRQSVTAVGDFGQELPERRSVGVFAGAPGPDFGQTVTLAQGERTRRQLRSLPHGLRNEAIVREVMTGDTAELAAVAQRAHERPFGAGEMFSDEFIAALVDLNKIRVGNLWTRHGEHQGSPLVRVARMVAIQPDESTGIVHVVSEVKV